MIATTIAAVLLMGARGMRSFYAEGRRGESLEVFVFSLVLAVGYPLIAVTAVQACFALQQVWLRLAVVAIAATTAATFPLLIVPLSEREGRPIYVASTLLGTCAVLAALWTVRRCGYRLVSIKTQRAEEATLVEPLP
jgi:hypothetical protein